jgi:hypothetical protein
MLVYEKRGTQTEGKHSNIYRTTTTTAKHTNSKTVFTVHKCQYKLTQEIKQLNKSKSNIFTHCNKQTEKQVKYKKS